MALCLSAALPFTATAWSVAALAKPAQPEFNLFVTNCNDAGSGSLRDTAATAFDGAFVDMTGLACSTISLSTGAIGFAAANLTLKGPTDHALTITGNDLDRVLRHDGAGTLTLDHLTVTHGAYAWADPGAGGGGCIRALGNVTLQHSTVSNCTLSGPGGYPTGGGGIYSKKNLTLTDSTLSGNVTIVSNNIRFFAYAGGALVEGNLGCTRSSIRNNFVIGPSNASQAGGAMVAGTSQIDACTVSGNEAGYFGGLQLGGNASCSNSTISGNSATAVIGGLFASGALTLDHCTIAFNTHFSKAFGGAGLSAAGSALLTTSSIIARNTSTQNGANFDLYLDTGTSFSGSNNFIVSSNRPSVPVDASDPKLAPLANNGGPTLTHALLPGSPAIDAGNNVHDLLTDQRGDGHPRIVGLAADIGSFEASDSIFASGFE